MYNTSTFQLKTKQSTSDTKGEKEAKVYNSVDNKSLDINESAKIHAVGYWKRLQEQGAMPSQLKSLRAVSCFPTFFQRLILVPFSNQ